MKPSINRKVTLLFALFLIILLGLICRAVRVRQGRVVWLENLHREMIPLPGGHSREIDGERTPLSTLPRARAGYSGANEQKNEAPPPRQSDALMHLTGLDSLPDTGCMNRAHFMHLRDEIEACARYLGSQDSGERSKGQDMLYRLSRTMCEEYSQSGGEPRRVMEQCMSGMSEAVLDMSGDRKCDASPARGEFVRWASRTMKGADTPELLFIIRLLGVVGDPGALDAIGVYGDSPLPEVRKAAMLSMGLLGAPEARDDIAAYLSDQDLPLKEGKSFLLALSLIKGRSSEEIVVGVLRAARPLLAYEAYLRLREMRGDTGKPLPLEEFEQRRKAVADHYAVRQGSGDL
ncbi:MAG: HEAT repeat domain-containing protein [Candidatus Aureabacteria bacterium]|nr:HEAT repeat domain-containing protein [Candidatus Auribacterota bacterium]